MIDLNMVQRGALAGLSAGLLALGAGGRIAMRLVALAAGLPPSFSAGGTLLILILGALLGIVFGLLFVAVERLLPGARRVQGVAYGSLLMLVFVAPPFFLAAEGELGLVAPLTGLAIFGPIPIVYGAILAGLVERFERRGRAEPRRPVAAGWVGLFGLSLILAFFGLTSLMNESAPLPPAIIRAAQSLGVPYEASHLANTMLAMAFALGYCGLAFVIFWRGSSEPMGRFAALALLLFAGAFFHTGALFEGMLNAMPLGRLLPGLIRALGFGSLLLLFYLFPDGRFVPRWTRPLAAAWIAWAFFWFLTPLPGSAPGPGGWPEPLLLVLVVSALGSALLAQLARYRQTSDPAHRRQTRPAVRSFAATVVGFAALWAATLLVPDLRIRGTNGMAALFTFTPYLVPWLLIPLSLVFAIRRRGLWEAGAATSESRSNSKELSGLDRQTVAVP